MKKIYFLLGITLFLCCLLNISYAQDAASATWPLTSATTVNATTAGQIAAQNEKLANMSINQYTGTDGSQRVQILGGTWPASQTDTITGTYIQFEAAPLTGNTFNVSSIAFKIGASGGGSMRAKAFFSTDPSFKTATQITELATQMAALTGGNLSTTVLLNINRATNITLTEGQSLYVRVYPWYTLTSSGKYVTLKDVMISGTTTAAATATAPVVTTASPATEITTTTATVSGDVTSDGGAAVTARGIAYGTTENPTIEGDKTTDGEGEGPFSGQLTGLTPATIYYARAYATNAEGTSYGDQVIFTTMTPVTAPSVTTAAVTNVTTTTAQSGGNVTATGGADVTARGVVWNTAGTPTTADSKTEDGTGEGSFTSQLSGLATGTTYFVRAYATNSEGTAYGEEISFTTPQAPAVTTVTNVTDISTTAATVSGNVTSDGGAAVTVRGIAYGTSENPTIAGSTTTAGEGEGPFSSQLTGLTPATIYFARAYATNAAGTSYGDQVGFTTMTPVTAPSVTTAVATNVTTTTAQSGGNVTATGGATVTARGVVWNTAGTPTTADSKTEDGTGEGSFTSQLSGLTTGTTYFVRAYATNSAGTAYGQEVSFTTETEVEEPGARPASATWPLTNPTATPPGTGQNVQVIGQIDAVNQQLSNMNINGYTGTNNSQRSQIWIGGSNAWPLSQTAIIPGVYNQFEVAPKPGNTLDVQSISFKIGAHSTTSMRARAFYSTDPDFAAANTTEFTGLGSGVALSTSALLTISATPNLILNEGQRLYVRIYPWVHNQTTTQTGKYVTLQDVTISGETSEIVTEPVSSVVWANDLSFTTTGAITGLAPSFSPAMKYFGPTNQTLPTTDTNEGVIAAAIQTVSQDWQAEPEPVESLYFQYAVSPQAGTNLNVTNVSLYIGGWFSSNLRAAIYYSKDPSFTNRTLLVADRPLVGNQLEPISVNLSEMVNPGETFYLRIYPHNTQAEAWAKLVAVHNVTISGTTSEATATAPVVTTVSATGISTTTATVSGNVTSDGGAAVTARGIAYGTTENPTIEGDKTEAGDGTGEFSSPLTGLTPGTTYYARAYATNAQGTSYGEQLIFSTPLPVGFPAVTTAPVTNMTRESAQSGGIVTATGGAAVTARGVVWNTTGTPTTADSKTEDGTGEGAFTSQLTGLTAQTTYYVRAYATNSEGTSYGQEVIFTTAPKKVLYITQEKTTWDAAAAPVNNDAIVQMLTRDPNIDVTVRVLTAAEAGAAATAIDMAPYDVVVVQESMGGGSAILTPAGTLGLAKITKPTIYNKPYALQSGRAFAVTSPVTPGAGIDASTLGNPILSITVPEANRASELFNGISFTDEAGTTPIFKIGATDNGGVATGTVVPKGFSYNNVVVLDPANRTLAEFPASTDRSIAATGTPVFFNDIPANTRIGNQTTQARMIMMGMNFGAMNKDAGTNITSQGLTLWRNAIYSLAGLAVPNTAVAPILTMPAVTTTAATNVTAVSAQSGGNVTQTGGTDVTARGVVWNTTGTPTIADSKTEDGTGAGAFTSQLTGLNGSTTYYVRAYATNSEGTAYGQEVMFTTLAPLTMPTVTTAPVTNLAVTTAQSGGNVTATGGAAVTARGVVWNTTGTPTIADSKTEDGTGEGAFTSQLTGLNGSTTYYVRAYATNSEGTAYGQEVMFTTLAPLTMPTVTTAPVTNLTFTAAQSGGNVTATGGATVTARGVVWNTTGTPTIADSKTEDGTGEGAFTSQLAGLNDQTTYYVRAYATNSEGTAYGQVVTFTTPTLVSVAAEVSNAAFSLSQNYPNPFNASTTIKFELKKASQITLEVYDITGKRIAILAEGSKAAGTHEVKFDNALKDGIYIYKLSAEGATATRKMVVTR